MVDADRDVLCRLLRRGGRDVDLIQSTCQRHIDEHDDYREARSLLQLLHDADAAANDSDDPESKRKRTN